MDDSIEFVMVLPGPTARGIRQQFAVIIRRNLAGDQSLHAEIDANAASSHPIAQMARESLDVQAPVSPELVGFKRRREELELLKMEEEIKGMAQTRILGLKYEMEQLSDPSNSKLDEPTRLMFKETLQGLLIQEKQSPPAQIPKKIELEAAGVEVDFNAEALDGVIKRFLCSLAETGSTQIQARELHKKYMEYYATTKGSLACMLPEKLFFQTIRNFPGILKARGRSSMIYKLDHPAIHHWLGGC